MDGADERRIYDACNSRDNGACEVPVVLPSHLLHMRYLLEMTDTDALVLGTITCIYLVGAQQLLTPLEWVVEE